MPIQIPADLTVVTLQDDNRNLPQRWTEEYARSVLQNASDLLKARADIEFPIGAYEAVSESMPAGTRSDAVDEPGYHFLSSVHRAGTGVRVLMVDRVSRPELGGEARLQTRVCLVAYNRELAPTGRMLAHELGHLLGLPHIDDRRGAGPGREREAAAWMRNLMYSGALNPDALLTAPQVERARSSALARRFGGR